MIRILSEIVSAMQLAGSSLLVIVFWYPFNMRKAVISQYIENQDTKVDGGGVDETTYGQALDKMKSNVRKSMCRNIWLNRLSFLYILIGFLAPYFLKGTADQSVCEIIIFAVILCVSALVFAEVKSEKWSAQPQTSDILNKKSDAVEMHDVDGHFSFDDFVDQYRDYRREHKVKLAELPKILVFIEAIVLVSMAITIINELWPKMIILVICAVVVFVALVIYYRARNIREQNGRENGSRRMSRYCFIATGLVLLGVNHSDESGGNRFIDYCKTQRDKLDRLSNVRKKGLLCLWAVPFAVILAIWASGILRPGIGALVFLTVVVLSIVVIICSICIMIEPAIDSEKNLYDDLVDDLEQIFIFKKYQDIVSNAMKHFQEQRKVKD